MNTIRIWRVGLRAARWKALRTRVRCRRRLADRGWTTRSGEPSSLAPLVAFWVAAPLIAFSLVAANATLDGWPGGSGDGVVAGLVPQHSQADVALRPVQVLRWKETTRFAQRFDIPVDLSRLIYDKALANGLEPELAFRLVRVESGFRREAVGPFGSIGYTQVQPSTARWLEPEITPDRLFEAETNLDLGFRYLRTLLDRYSGDTRLALLTYNRGPGTVAALLAVGQDPSNGYDRRVLGKGTEPVRIARLEAAWSDRNRAPEEE